MGGGVACLTKPKLFEKPAPPPTRRGISKSTWPTTLNPIDKLVEYFAPQAALKGHAARPSRKRKFHRDNAAPNLPFGSGFEAYLMAWVGVS